MVSTLDEIGNLTLRCYVEHATKAVGFGSKLKASGSLVLVFDTETTVDEAQTLLFGSCIVYSNSKPIERYIFLGDYLKTADAETIEKFAASNGCTVISGQEFVDKVFYPYVYRAKAKCVGFNLPFDLTRLGTKYTKSRIYSNGFSIKLSSNLRNPDIVIKSLNTKAAFIQFTRPIRKKSDKKRKHYSGYFLDLKTATFALTNESYTLARALEDFDCDLRKIHPEKHGKVTQEYLMYNLTDTEATYELYEKVVERYSWYQLEKELNEMYSPASIGKAYLAKIGIKPFLEMNPGFPKNVLGYLMTAYYGGRTEVKCRNTPALATYLDFTSMYPTVYSLVGMDAILKANSIQFRETTATTQHFLDNITLEDIGKRSTWNAQMLTLCKVIPDNDVLPVRSLYGSKHAYTIGVNYLKSEDGTALWYALPDLIASKLLSGKTPRILEAISFTPEGTQRDLQQIELLNNVTVSPTEDFIKKIIEERLRIKREARGLSSDTIIAKQAELKQIILKIIANSTSYGIFIEINTEHQPEQTTVHGLETFEADVARSEMEGKAFNPIIGVFVTAAARLILATAETLLISQKSHLLYCDTDSIFVPPGQVQLIQDFFKPLNPYSNAIIPAKDIEMFKVEDYEDDLTKKKQPLKEVLFYGISSKRYVLFRIEEDGSTKILKHSSHGVGHILGIDEKQWWKDILTLHEHPELGNSIIKKYEDKYAVSRLSISNYDTFSRFEGYNARRKFKKQIKPFNFVTVGTSYRIDEETGRAIVPMLPYTPERIDDDKPNPNFLDIPFRPFIDYKTNGKHYRENTEFYWLTLSEMFNDYRTHPEGKFEGVNGYLQRRRLAFNEFSINYIGKESNELEESEAIGPDIENYNHYSNPLKLIEKHKELLHSLRPKEAARFGLMGEVWNNVLSCVDNNTLHTLQKKTIYRVVKLIEAHLKSSIR